MNRGTREGFLEVAALTQCSHGPSASALHSPVRVSSDLTPLVGHQSLVSLRALARGASLQGRSKGRREKGRRSFAGRCLLMV